MATWTGATANYSVTTNWSGGVPTNATDAIFDGAVSNANCTINTAGLVCFNFTIQNGYTGTITFTNTLTVRGSIAFATSVFFAGPNGIQFTQVTLGPAVTFNSNNKAFNLPLTISNNLVTITFVNTWTVTNFVTISISSNNHIYTGGIVNVTGNLTSAQPTGVSTTQFILAGTGTFSTSQNWSPPTEINSPSGTITLGSVRLANGCVFKYNPLSLNNIIASPGDISIQSIGQTCTLDLQNQAVGSLTTTGNSVVTLLSNANVLNATLGDGNGTGVTVNGLGLRLNVRGNFRVGQLTNQLSGTATVTLTGSGTLSSASAALSAVQGGIGVDLELNTSGTYTATSNIALTTAGKTFTRTNGTINWSNFTLFVNANRTFATAGITFNNISFSPFSTSNSINSLLTVSGILFLNGAITFSGTAGWTCANLVCTTTGAFFITLQEGITYTTTANVSITGGVAAGGLRPTMKSSGVGNAFWTLDPGAAQSLIYVNGTRIDSSGGQTVWSFGVAPADIVTSINWNIGTRPGTVAYVFIF